MLSEFRIKRAIDVLAARAGPSSADRRAARNTIRRLGSRAVPSLIDALARTPRPQVLEELLGELLGSDSQGHIRRALAGDRGKAEALTRVLARTERLDPGWLLDLYEEPSIPDELLSRVLCARLDRLQAGELLRRLDVAGPAARKPLLELLGRVVTEPDVPDLVARLRSADPELRAALAHLLGGIDAVGARAALVGLLLDDPYREVRLAALEQIESLDEPPIEALCEVLHDPEMIVRNRGIECLVRLDRGEAVPLLARMLDAPADDVRRGAIEVLNEIGTEAAADRLVAALRDPDWWVRTRAGDALGKLGGAVAARHVLELVSDPDESIAASALDILERSSDDAQLDVLLGALSQGDRGLKQGAIRALGRIGESRVIPALVEQFHSEDETIRSEALAALERLADGPRGDLVLSAVNEMIDTTADERLRRTSLAAVSRLSRKVRSRRTLGPRPSLRPEHENGGIVRLRVPPGTEGEKLDPLRLRPGTLLADRYRVVRQVGRGGFGVVVLVVDEMVRDEIILKFLTSDLATDPHAIERFKHELRFSRKITHENVIRIYDLVSFGSSLAISMEYFPSHSLATEIGRKIAPASSRWIAMLRQVCAGLAEAHRERVVHRDLKPGNILIGERDLVKIVDFGLSAAANPGASRLTRSGLVIGTPTYMSPEQIRGSHVDGRSDIYSLGIVMYEMFAGQAPYAGQDPLAILFQHLEGAAPRPRELNPAISSELESVIDRAMALDPGERFPTTEALARALEAVPELAGA